MSQAIRETSLWKDQERLITFHRAATILEKTTQEVLTLFKAQINTCPPNYGKLIQVTRLVINVIKSMESNIVMAYSMLRHSVAKKQLAQCMQLLETQQKLRQEAMHHLMKDILAKQLNEIGISNCHKKLNESEKLSVDFNRLIKNCAITLKIEVKKLDS